MYVSRSGVCFSRFELIRVLGRFIKTLVDKASDVQDAMAKLDRLSTLEDKMIAAITLATVKDTNLDLMAMRREFYRGCDCFDQ